MRYVSNPAVENYEIAETLPAAGKVIEIDIKKAGFVETDIY